METGNYALRISAAVLIAFSLAGCEGTSDTSATVQKHTPEAADGVLAGVSPRAVTVQAFSMKRGVGVLPGRIGERTTVGNVSMGYVTISPPPEVLFTDAIRSEISAAGHSVSGGPSTVSGTVQRFALSTPATALYWDVTIDAALSVNVNGTQRNYSDVCVTRTAAWPSDSLISKVANECVSRITAKFRKDRSIANAL
ncbi:MAG: hypothetical protein ABJI96_09695 [Paracoccaceae bacterium]